MSADALCPQCNKYAEVMDPWDRLGRKVGCPHCGTPCVLEYDETYDEESGEELGWFWLSRDMESGK